MVRALDPGDGANPTPSPGPAVVAGNVQQQNLGRTYDILSGQGVTPAKAQEVVQALAYDQILTALRYADLCAQALAAYIATPSTPLPAAFPDWKARWLAARPAVAGAAGDILLTL